MREKSLSQNINVVTDCEQMSQTGESIEEDQINSEGEKQQRPKESNKGS